MNKLIFEPNKTDCHDFSEWCKSLLDLYDTRKFIEKDGQIYKLSLLSMHRWITAHPFDGKNKILQTMLLDAIVSADNAAPGSGVYVPWFLYNKLESQFTERCSSLDYSKMTVAKLVNSKTNTLFNKIFEHAGPTTKLVVKKSQELNPVIRYRSAFQFPLELDSQFHRMIGDVENIEQHNPIVIFIEGAPETVGEINSLLQWNNQTKRPVILIARSFAEEISATLATNWLKNSLSILPIRYGDSLETINLAADMCAVTKGELISLHFGDAIAVAVTNKDKWGTADSIVWNRKGLFINKDVDISKHINSLLTKISDADNEEVQKIYQDRILSLSNDALEIWVPEDDIETIEELNSLVLHYNAFVVSGTVKTPIGNIPKCFVKSATEAAESFKNSVDNIGGFLLQVGEYEVVA